MRDKLHEYLLERPGGASPRELLDLVFTQPGADPEFGPRFLHALLAPDPRFVWRAGDGTWNARLHETLVRPLSDTTFVVVDVETTGGAAAATNIIEIGAARVRSGRVLEEFQQLVNPGSRLPAFITRLTGIDDTMLADQPPITAVWPRFVEFLGDAVIVAHNAAFDVGFLNAAALAHNGRALSQPHLCTLRLARRLMPELRRRSLDVLAGHFGIPTSDRHRALGDVRITVEIFFHLLERLAARGIGHLHQALDLQHHARDGRRFVCLLPRDKVAQLPAEPGIYRFFGGDGRLLYIGKAKNLRERVGSYLSNAAGHSNKTLDLIRHSCDVRVQVTGSELEAALEEAEAIRRHKPPYNRLGKHLPRIAFIKLSIADEFPRLSITGKLGSRQGAVCRPLPQPRAGAGGAGAADAPISTAHLSWQDAPRSGGGTVFPGPGVRLYRTVWRARVRRSLSPAGRELPDALRWRPATDRRRSAPPARGARRRPAVRGRRPRATRPRPARSCWDAASGRWAGSSGNSTFSSSSPAWSGARCSRTSCSADDC